MIIKKNMNRNFHNCLFVEGIMHMNVFGKFMKKEKSQVENSMFAKHGFVKVKDKNKKIFVTVNEIEYLFEFETNKVYDISANQIEFSVCVCKGNRMLFINKDVAILEGTTSPYRTFYSGLMKEPFKFCFPYNEPVIIKIKEGAILKFIVIE